MIRGSRDISLILNPNAGSAAHADALHAVLAARRDVAVVETRAPGDARDLAARARIAGCPRVVAAGGDGTVSEVVSGLLAEAAGHETTLGIVPLGTGNDLARTLALPSDTEAALRLALDGAARPIDVIEARAEGRVFHGVNVAAGGFSGQVDEVLTDELKASWGPLAYLLGAVKVLPDLTRYDTRIVYDDGAWTRVAALNVVVANGRTVGGGTVIAPDADLEDGLLDVAVVEYGSAAALAGVAARLLVGNYLASDQVTHHRARAVAIESRPGMWFNLDGELLTNAPIAFRVLPRALACVVGPGYRAATA
jgi:diacylglycerol kinase (ATP)